MGQVFLGVGVIVPKFENTVKALSPGGDIYRDFFNPSSLHAPELFRFFFPWGCTFQNTTMTPDLDSS